MTAFTLLFFVTAFVIVFTVPTPNASQVGFLEWSSTLCKSGFGAILGLLGGKITDILSGDEAEDD